MANQSQQRTIRRTWHSLMSKEAWARLEMERLQVAVERMRFAHRKLQHATANKQVHAPKFSVCSRQHFVRESLGPVQFPELLNLLLSLIGWPRILHDEGFARQKTGNSTRPTTCTTGVPNAPDFVRLHVGDCAVGYVKPETQKLMIGDFFKLDCAPVKGQITEVLRH